ncbi:MAG: 4'-phosphopantetheinyl transferase superfamily protein [Pseudomonadota bacterium]
MAEGLVRVVEEGPFGVAGAVKRVTLPFDTDLYQLRIDLLEPYEDLLSPLLSAQELQTAAQLSRRQSRLESAITRACLKLLVADRLKADPHRLSVRRDERKKPYVSFGDEIYRAFNVSHSYPWSLIAFADDGRLGVDVETIRPLEDVENLARLTMAPAELEELTQAPAARQPGLFLKNWTRKEAVMKALGIGIDVPLRQVLIDPPKHGDADPVQVSCAERRYGTFYIIDASTDAYAASIALQGETLNAPS